MKSTCYYCKRRNIVNLSRHYAYCTMVKRHLQTVASGTTHHPSEKSCLQSSVQTKEQRKKRKINLDTCASSRSPSPTQSSNNCILSPNSSCDDFSYNMHNKNKYDSLCDAFSFSEPNHIISEFPECMSLPGNVKSPSYDSTSITSSGMNLRYLLK